MYVCMHVCMYGHLYLKIYIYILIFLYILQIYIYSPAAVYLVVRTVWIDWVPQNVGDTQKMTTDRWNISENI